MTPLVIPCQALEEAAAALASDVTLGSRAPLLREGTTDAAVTDATIARELQLEPTRRHRPFFAASCSRRPSRSPSLLAPTTAIVQQRHSAPRAGSGASCVETESVRLAVATETVAQEV